VTAWDPDPGLGAIGLYGCLFVVPILLALGLIPWLFFRLDLFEARYLVPAMLACVLVAGGAGWAWKRKYKDVPVAELLPRLVDEADGPAGVAATDRVRGIGWGLWAGEGARWMRQAYDAVGRPKLRELWAGIGGWPDTYADPLVDELVELLERDARDPATQGGFGHRDRIRAIGEALDRFGGIELMKKVYYRVRERGPYFSQDIWHLIGEWRE
jgi:hypothetical protein